MCVCVIVMSEHPGMSLWLRWSITRLSVCDMRVGSNWYQVFRYTYCTLMVASDKHTTSLHSIMEEVAAILDRILIINKQITDNQRW